MTDVVARIAEVLRLHGTPIGGYCRCGFDCAPDTPDTYADHVAGVVAEALGLAAFDPKWEMTAPGSFTIPVSPEGQE